MGRAILMSVADGLRAIRLHWCDQDGRRLAILEQGVQLNFKDLPERTSAPRDDAGSPPNASIDRAISMVGAEMLSWSKDPESFELIEHQRCKLFFSWPGGVVEEVDQYAYGLWDA